MSARELFEVHYFSNDTEYRIWRSKWCNKCVNDVNDDCPIITNMMVGLPEPSLTQERPGWYTCSQFVELEEFNEV